MDFGQTSDLKVAEEQILSGKMVSQANFESLNPVYCCLRNQIFNWSNFGLGYDTIFHSAFDSLQLLKQRFGQNSSFLKKSYFGPP